MDKSILTELRQSVDKIDVKPSMLYPARIQCVTTVWSEQTIPWCIQGIDYYNLTQVCTFFYNAMDDFVLYVRECIP